MADATGLTLAIPGVFNSAVQCFDYIQIARNFDRDYQTATLKLDVARLRLSRWGASVGLDRVDEHTSALPRAEGTADEHEIAEELLKQIIELFDNAERQAATSKLKKSEQGANTYDTERDLDQTTASLHQKLRRLSLQRFKPSNIVKKAKWALQEEKFLNRLIEDITDLINQLVTEFPAAQPEQTRLCIEEGTELAADDHASMLVPIADKQDPELSAALKSLRSKPAGQTVNVTFAGSKNSGLQQGYFSGHQTNHFGGHT